MDRQPYFTSEGAAGFTTVGFCVWPEEKQEKKRVEVRTSSLYKIFFLRLRNVCPHSEKKGLKEAENEERNFGLRQRRNSKPSLSSKASSFSWTLKLFQ